MGYGGVLSAFNEDFEHDTTQMFLTSPWAFTTAIAVSGDYSLTDSPLGNYNNNTDVSAVIPPVQIGANYGLTFQHIALIRTPDIGRVEATTDYINYTPLGTFVYSSHRGWGDLHADSGDWYKEIIDLSAFSGQAVSIRFRLITDGTNVADGWYLDDISIGPLTSVEMKKKEIPTTFLLEQNYPNPFNPATTIRFYSPQDANIVLKVYNVLGQEIATLANERKTAGYHEVRWNARDAMSGVYFYKLTAGKFTDIKKMVLMK
jgi:hypothetical protein